MSGVVGVAAPAKGHPNPRSCYGLGMATPRKPHKPSNNEKAAARIEALIKAGAVVKVEAPRRGYWTVGPYHMATGKSGFATLSYGGAGSTLATEQEFWEGPSGAARAAQAIVARCGSTRAREAAVKAERKIARHVGPF